MQSKVTFETKCYEKDWRFLLLTDRLKKAISYNQYPFAETILSINNVHDVEEVSFYASKLVEQGVLTSYIIVEQFADEALAHFNIEKDSFRSGYYYSIAELVSIYRCRTTYLLHYSGDSILERPLSWVEDAITRMEANSQYKVANPTWNGHYFEAKQESWEEDDRFYIGYGFSDQCYLINAVDFRAANYNETHPESARYPSYGGELFEKRVDAWMRNHQYYRLTYKHGSYLHPNYEGMQDIHG